MHICSHCSPLFPLFVLRFILLHLYQQALGLKLTTLYPEAGFSWSWRVCRVQVGIFQRTLPEPESGLFMADVQRRWPSGQTDSGRRYREQEERGKWKMEKTDPAQFTHTHTQAHTRLLQVVFQWIVHIT